MHGHKRAEYKNRFRDAQVAAGLAQKAQQWYTLSDKILELQQDPSSSSTLLPLLNKMLRVNPDPLYLWNIRRTMLLQQQQQHQHQQQQQQSKEEEDWLPAELSLTAAGLEKNPKAYGAWFHRKWALQQQLQQAPTTMKKLLWRELALTDVFLQRDERNFHCWNFRRFLVGLELQLHTTTATRTSTSTSTSTRLCSNGGTAGTGDGSWIVHAWNKDHENCESPVIVGPQITASTSTTEDATNNSTSSNLPKSIRAILQREWDFTQGKIVTNFSNFSAFHYRTKLLLLAHFDNKEGWSPRNAFNSDSRSVQSMALQEWSLTENIMFTEPDDQTIWWYHRFLLDWVHEKVAKPFVPEENHWYSEWLQRQAETLQVLVDEDEGGCKWGLLAWHLVLSRLVLVTMEERSIHEGKTQMAEVLDKLIQADPDRTQRYQIMKKQLSQPI
jgi:geranylgeranyl transferase type-2 subunit alpha